MRKTILSKRKTVLIEIRNLSFRHPKQNKPFIEIPLWQLKQGEQVLIHGPSGCGKSTFLNLLSGMLTPQEGEICILEQDIVKLSSRQQDRFRAQHTAYIFQQFNLIPYLSVAQNISAAAYFSGKGNSSQKVLANTCELLDRLQLPSHVLHAKADALSIGQQQRVAIARALINSPQLLIVDEPTSALDADARDSFMALLKEVANDSTMIFVSHDNAMERYFDRHCRISELSPPSTTQPPHAVKHTSKPKQESQ